MPPKTPGEMSAFERRRLENIAANNAILKDISKTAAKILPQKPKAPTPKRSSAPRARREQPKRETARPVRMSSRLAGIDAEQIKVKRELDLDTGRADRPAKKTRVSGDLNLGEILVEGRKFAGAEALASLKINRGAEPGVRTFFKEDADGDENSSLKDMREQMSSLQIYDKWEVNGKHSELLIGKNWALLTTSRRYQDRTSENLLHGIPPHGGEADHICRR